MMEFYNKENDNTISFIKYIPNFIDSEKSKLLYEELNNENYIGGFTDYGHPIPRIQKWMHDDNQPFSLLWKTQYKRWQPQNYSPQLKNIQKELVNIYLSKYTFPNEIKTPNINSSLINVYRDGNDSIAFHRDNLPEFGDNPTILVISLGSTRNIQFRRVLYDAKNPKLMKKDKNNQNMNFDINLEHGSLLIMGGSTQKYFSHGIDKDSTCKDKRFSITFREHKQVNFE
jgi:alkylated DNA repair dioxygenase AlkB